jgi:hypothetical protein
MSHWNDQEPKEYGPEGDDESWEVLFDISLDSVTLHAIEQRYVLVMRIRNPCAIECRNRELVCIAKRL